LTPLLKRLEEKGYIIRLKPEKDRRQLIVQLTDEGKILQQQVESRLLDCFANFEGLDEDKALELIEQNNRMIQLLQQKKK